MDTEKSQMTSCRDQHYGTILSVTADHVDSAQPVETVREKMWNLSKRVLLVLFLLGILVIASIIYFENVPTQQQKSLDLTTNNTCVPVCQTDVCGTYADLLNETMDFSVDPCDDFYQHVCGNWKPKASQFRFQNENAHRIVQYALEDKLTGNSTALAYLADMYEDCIDWSKRDQLGAKPIRALLKQVLGDDWSFVVAHEPTAAAEFTFVDGTDHRQHSIGSVGQFAKLWNLWKASKSKVEPNHHHVHMEEWMDSYVSATLIKVPSLISKIEISAKDYYPIRIRLAESPNYSEKVASLYEHYVHHYKTISTLFDTEQAKSNSTHIMHAQFEVMEFKLKLTRIYKDDINSWSGVKAITLAQLNEHSFGHFNWTRLMNKLLNNAGATSMQVNDNDHVTMLISHVDLTLPLTQLISSTPIRVLKNVIALDILESAEKLFSVEVPSGRKRNDWVAWRLLINNNFESLIPLYTRLFVDYQDREKMQNGRKNVNEMVNSTKAILTELLKHNYTWLDERTKKKAIKKVHTVDAQISHSDWIFEDEALDEEFGFDNSSVYPLQSITGNFIGSYFNLIRIMESGRFRRMANKDGLVQKRNPFHRVFHSTGYYSPTFNQLVISHALLRDPTFDMDYPAELNYGMMGSIIAHELLHIFYNYGRYIDSKMRLINWWTDEDVKQVENRSKCFVRQYDQLADQNTGIKIDWEDTQEEDLADNGAVKLAYAVLEKHLNLSPECNSTRIQTLPSFLAQYSPQQLFFLSFGLLYCSNEEYSPEDTHSLDKYRVNIPLSNFDKFSQTFNCPVGSRMNPKDKCALW